MLNCSIQSNLSFLNYLEDRKIIVSSQREEVRQIIQEDLVTLIRDNFDSTIIDLYHCTDPNQILQWRDKIFNHPILSQFNATSSSVTLQQLLIAYRDFLLSGGITEDATPYPAPENKQSNETNDTETRSEGELKTLEIVTHKRSRDLREDCIKNWKSLHGNRVYCACCGIDFEKTYGEIGNGYIEIHHLYPISQFPDAHEVNPKEDLIPLCSNCHSMIHAKLPKGHCRPLEELQATYKGHEYTQE